MNIKKRIKEKINDEFYPDGYSFEMFETDIEGQKKQFKDQTFLIGAFRRELKLEKDFLELIVNKNDQLVTALDGYLLSEKKHNRLSNLHTYMQLKDFTLIQITIANNYRAVKDLLLKGLTYQALVLFRNIIEITELAIGILGDGDLHKYYRQDSTGDYPESKSIKFNTIKTKTNKILHWIKSLPNQNLSTEIWDVYLSVRDDLYENSSKHVHSNFTKIIINAYVKPMAVKKFEIDEDLVIINLGGMITDQTKMTIRDVLIYESLSSRILAILLIEKYKMPFKYFGDASKYTTALFKISSDLLKEYLQVIQNITPEST